MTSAFFMGKYRPIVDPIKGELMKLLSGLSLFLVLTANCMASDYSQTLICSSPNQSPELEVKLNYSSTGVFSATTEFEGIKLKAVKTIAFKVLEGWTGDIDSNTSLQLTLIPTERSDLFSAVFVQQEKIDRVGLETKVTQLDCHQK
jgi:hypothetical protein